MNADKTTGVIGVYLRLSAAFIFGALATHAAPVVVASDGSGDYKTVSAALASGANEIRIKPGVYHERLVIDRAHIALRGLGGRPEDVVLSYDLSAGTAGGTTKSASVTVSGDDFYAENLTIENTFTRTRPLEHEGSQAVALKVTGDRAVFRRVRFLGYQDTLYAASKSCASDAGPCVPARQYFADCYIDGNVDFIFGDALAYFENCEFHALEHSQVMLTAQSRHYAEERSGYVFDHCRLTAEAGARHVYLGRPWRAYATVVFRDTEMGAEIEPAGWHEWEHNGKPSLPTAFYAEYHSRGPGANAARRQLTDAEAAQFERRKFLAGEDRWEPTEVH
jgi:pectin methylesterase-like acyl-CoA thioesterase